MGAHMQTQKTDVESERERKRGRERESWCWCARSLLLICTKFSVSLCLSLYIFICASHSAYTQAIHIAVRTRYISYAHSYTPIGRVHMAKKSRAFSFAHFFPFLFLSWRRRSRCRCFFPPFVVCFFLLRTCVHTYCSERETLRVSRTKPTHIIQHGGPN